jgi:pyruvate dehydrogenase E2 component (dihydrolipoamide acetyltransferase)
MEETLKMPKLGMAMEQGTIVRLLKKVGDKIAKEEEYVEVETDKITNALESPKAGTVKEILVKEGDTVPVGGAIMRIEEDR